MVAPMVATLLDTHALLWLEFGDSRLGPQKFRKELQ